MRLVTLTTDWGNSDYYIGAVKAKLYSEIDGVQVVDINHRLEKFDHVSAAFIVKNTCMNFPEGSVHIIDVDTSDTEKTPNLIIEYNKQYFICNDNGIPNLVFSDLDDYKIYIIDSLYDSEYFTFVSSSLFVSIAKKIIEKQPLEDFTIPVDDFENKSSIPQPICINGFLVCTVYYVDSYGNVFLNITEEEFYRVLNNRRFHLELDTEKVVKISDSYSDVEQNFPLITVSSSKHLQIAINKANASQLLGLEYGTQVKIKIID